MNSSKGSEGPSDFLRKSNDGRVLEATVESVSLEATSLGVKVGMLGEETRESYRRAKLRKRVGINRPLCSGSGVDFNSALC